MRPGCGQGKLKPPSEQAGWPKWRPSGRQDGPKGAKEFIWRSFGSTLESKFHLWAISADVRFDWPCAVEMEVLLELEVHIEGQVGLGRPI